MVVYADILMAVNLIVDYFLLLLTAEFLHREPSLARLLLGAGVGAATSLYIFLPDLILPLETLLKLLASALMTAVCFGFGGIKRFLKATAVLFAVSFGYAGAMTAIWYILKPDGMVINNSVVYFSVSPLFLIAFSVIGYFLSAVLRRIFERECPMSQRCEITVFVGDKSERLTAAVDSGNSLSDVFGSSQVIITDSLHVDRLFSVGNATRKPDERYRVLPCRTVSGTALLDGYRCDRAVIKTDKKITELKSPILAVSKTGMDDGCEAIVNPKVLEL